MKEMYQRLLDKIATFVLARAAYEIYKGPTFQVKTIPEGRMSRYSRKPKVKKLGRYDRAMMVFNSKTTEKPASQSSLESMAYQKGVIDGRNGF
jgi:hypothetical protein